MHPETKKNTKTEATTKPGLVASYDIWQGNGVGLYWETKNTHIFTYLLTFSGPTLGQINVNNQLSVTIVHAITTTTENKDKLNIGKVHVVNKMNLSLLRCWQRSNDSGDLSKSVTALRQCPKSRSRSC